MSHEKAVSTATRPFRPIQRAHSKLRKSVPKPQAMESGVAWTFNPFTSCQTNSAGPPFTVETTGFPAHHASSNTIPKGSFRLGTHTTSHALYRRVNAPLL